MLLSGLTTQYDASERVVARRLGTTSYYTYSEYYDWGETGQGGRLAQTWTTNGTYTRQDLAYTYDQDGNVHTITDAANSSQEQTFGYDAARACSHHRLTSAVTSRFGNGQYNETYTYQSNTGTLASKTGQGSYTYSGSQPYHGVRSTSAGNSYSYDANGNMTGRTVAGTTYTLSYDYENRLTDVTDGTSSFTFVYDGDGNWLKVISSSGTTLFIGSYLEKTSTNEKIYYYEGGERVAMRTAGAAYFLLTDQLGSTTVTLTSTGSQNGRLLYHPWGSVRYTTGSVPTSARYTGQIDHATIAGGIMYYGARYYDNSLGRWLSPDSIIPDQFSPQSYDRFSYVRNNPTNRIDPTGHRDEGPGEVLAETPERLERLRQKRQMKMIKKIHLIVYRQ